MTSFQSSIIVIIKHKFQEKKKLTKNRFLILLSILFFLILLQHDAEIVLPSYFHFRRASFFNFHLVPIFDSIFPAQTLSPSSFRSRFFALMNAIFERRRGCGLQPRYETSPLKLGPGDPVFPRAAIR